MSIPWVKCVRRRGLNSWPCRLRRQNSYVPGVYKAVPERSFPYGGSYLRRAKRSFGHPYVNPYYGSYYAPEDYYNYWAYYAPYYWNYYSGSSYGYGCLQRVCR